MKALADKIDLALWTTGCVVAGLLLLVFMTGCEGGDKKSAQVTTRPVGASQEHYLVDPGSTVAPVIAIKAAPKPTKTMGTKDTCITAECHVTFATAPHIHGPVSEKACYACHSEDLGGHKFPLKRTGNDTCTFCHSVAGSMSHQHKAIEQGCISCHRPHESKSKFLLKTDTVEQLCQTCHSVPLKKNAHGPFAKGDCSACHQPHQSQFAFLLRGGEGSQHCFTCHKEMRQKLVSASVVHKPLRQDCSTCHNPHSTDYAYQLKQPQDQLCYSCHRAIKAKVQQAAFKHGAMLAADQCANCHDPHGSNEPRLLKARTDSVCLSCHNKSISAPDGHKISEMKTVMASKFLHGPNRAGNCSACHDPHGGKYPKILDKAFPDTFYTSFDIKKYDLCFSCHEPQLVLSEKTTSLTNFRDGEENLHFLHVNRDKKGRTCKTCHEVHGSDLPRHLATDVPFEGSNWAMPINYEQSPQGGKCTPGCHKERAYSRWDRGTGVSPMRVSPTTRGVQ